jgi:hypothetical protein
MMSYLAEAAGANDMVSLGALGAFIGTVLTAVGVFLARNKYKEQGAREALSRTVTIADQPVSFTQTAAPASQNDLDEHIARTDKQISSIWEAIQTERGIARTALSRIHERLDMQSKVTATLQGSVEEVGKNVGRLLDLALNRKPPTR